MYYNILSYNPNDGASLSTSCHPSNILARSRRRSPEVFPIAFRFELLDSSTQLPFVQGPVIPNPKFWISGCHALLHKSSGLSNRSETVFSHSEHAAH